MHLFNAKSTKNNNCCQYSNIVDNFIVLKYTECNEYSSQQIILYKCNANELKEAAQNYEGNLLGEAWRTLCQGGVVALI
jgi:hypothetical protein